MLEASSETETEPERLLGELEPEATLDPEGSDTTFAVSSSSHFLLGSAASLCGCAKRFQVPLAGIEHFGKCQWTDWLLEDVASDAAT